MRTTCTCLRRLAIVLALGGATLSCAAAAPWTMHSDPDAMARAALGEQPGQAVVGVWRDGAEVFGQAGNGAPAVPAATTPLFEIGSVSKVFTGLLLAQAVERGDLALDDKLGRLLPGTVTLTPNVAAITLRQLVTHSSCLPRMPANFPPEDASRNPYRQYDRAMLWAALSVLSLDHAGPCEPAYSNMGMAVVGELLSQRYGKPWQALVAERITGPLAMRDTVQQLDGNAARLAPAFAGARPTPPWDFMAFAGTGALRSSAADMLALGRAIMAGKDGPLGGAAERLLQPLGKYAGGEIGYAIMMRGPAGHRTYFHDGTTGGFRTDWLLMPDTHEALIVMASNQAAPIEKIGLDLLAQRYRIADAGSADASQGKRAPVADYGGVFRIDPRLAFTFVAQDGLLYGRLTGQLFFPLTPGAPDVYSAPQVGAEFTFVRTAGKVTEVVLHQRGGELRGTLTGEPLPPKARYSAAAVDAYAAHYIASVPGSPVLDFDVRAHDGQLTTRLNDQPVLPVYPVPDKADRYAADVVAAEFQFERDGAGRVTALVLHQNGAAIRATRAKLAAPPRSTPLQSGLPVSAR
jgi:serine-type D-Ala-D-Ala carboxypeptidase/endopeptidase